MGCVFTVRSPPTVDTPKAPWSMATMKSFSWSKPCLRTRQIGCNPGRLQPQVAPGETRIRQALRPALECEILAKSKPGALAGIQSKPVGTINLSFARRFVKTQIPFGIGPHPAGAALSCSGSSGRVRPAAVRCSRDIDPFQREFPSFAKRALTASEDVF